MRNVLLALLFLPSISWAALIKFDQIGPSSGTLSYDGAGGALIGTDIYFDYVIGSSTPANDGSILSCVNCYMNFQTGLFSEYNLGSYKWLGGGSLVISGELWDGGTQIASGDLAWGTFSDFVEGQIFNIGGGLTGTFFGAGEDDKNADLTAYYGLLNPFVFAESQLALSSSDGGCTQDATTHAFDCLVTDADFNNSAVNEPPDVPAPATLALIGLGLLGIGAMRKKRAVVSSGTLCA